MVMLSECEVLVSRALLQSEVAIVWNLLKSGLYVGRQAQRIATPRLMTDHKDACANDTRFY